MGLTRRRRNGKWRTSARRRGYFIDTVNHSGSPSGETAYCFHSFSGDVDYGICQLTLMTATPQVVERDENCESPKT
jgi:hypothetical protein